MIISRKSTLRNVMQVPEAVAILDEHIPAFTSDPQIELCMDMRMTVIIAFPEMGISPEEQEEILSEFDEIGEV